MKTQYLVTIEKYHLDDAQALYAALSDTYDENSLVLIENKETNRIFVRYLTEIKPDQNCYNANNIWISEIH